MSKSKYAPALFEVIDSGKDSTSRGKLAVPEWMKSSQPAKPVEEPPPAEETSMQEPAEESDLPDIRSSSNAVVETPPITIIDEPHSILRLRQGRVEISLNPVSSFVVACVLVLLLVQSPFRGVLL